MEVEGTEMSYSIDMKKEKVTLGSIYLQIASNTALSLPVTFLDIVIASTFYEVLCMIPLSGGGWC